MIITERALVDLLFSELDKKMYLNPPKKNVAELILMLRKQVLPVFSEQKIVDIEDFDLNSESVRFVSAVVNDFDHYFERWIAELSWFKKVLYYIGNRFGRERIIATQVYLGSLCKCTFNFFIY